MPILELADWVQTKLSGKRSGRRRRSKREPEFSLLWIPAVPLLLVALMRHLVGPFFVEVEILLELLIFRLILLAGGLVLLLLAAVKRKWAPAACIAVAVLVLFIEAAHHVDLLPDLPRSPHARTDLRVFTQNVGMAAPDSWEPWLEQNRIDVAFLQELYMPKRAEWEAMAERQLYEHIWVMAREDAGMGGMILSKYPLTERPALESPSSGGRKRNFVWGSIDFNGTDIELIGVHLESFHMVGSKSGMFGRDLFSSASFRQKQAMVLANAVEAIEAEGLPLILAGDFNASPTFRSVRGLRGRLNDSWLEAGSGLGGTFPVDFPVIRIDAILHHGFVADYAAVTPISTSDHRGVTAVLNLLRE